MVDMKNLEKVLALHDNAFALLRWVGSQLQRGVLDMAHVHTSTSAGEAAEEWIRRNYSNLPTDVRPSMDELRAFANLFASYLQTSFEVGTKHRRVSSCGCYCSFCSYLSNTPYLKARSLPKKARETATALKRLYLQELAHDSGVAASQSTLEELASAKTALAREVAMATYAKELLRRTEYVTQGEGVYALWREFAWVDGHPDRKVKLTVKSVEHAQDSIVAEMRNRLA